MRDRSSICNGEVVPVSTLVEIRPEFRWALGHPGFKHINDGLVAINYWQLIWVEGTWHSGVFRHGHTWLNGDFILGRFCGRWRKGTLGKLAWFEGSKIKD